ncbi:MAG: STAS domain-containing protein [Acidimicrobiales bacterium]
MAALGAPGSSPAVAPNTASVTDVGDGTVKILGELDVVGARRIQAEFDAIVNRIGEGVVFDLGGLEFMDSSGIALLLGAVSRVGPVGVRHPSAVIARVIQLTGLSDLLVIEPG